MFAELFEALKKEIVNAKEPLELSPEGTHSRKRLVYFPATDMLKEFDAAPPRRTHKLHTLESFVAATQKFGSANTVIWVGVGQVIADLEGLSDDRGARLTWSFPMHPAFQALKALETGEGKRSHASLVNWLRSDIGDASITPADMFQRIRVVKFDTLTASSSESAKDLAKMGREVAAMVHGLDAIPDKFMLRFDPYPSMSKDGIDQVEVESTLQVRVEESLFLLKPIAGQIAEATAQAQEDLRDVVADILPDVPVFSGSPE